MDGAVFNKDCVRLVVPLWLLVLALSQKPAGSDWTVHLIQHPVAKVNLDKQGMEAPCCFHGVPNIYSQAYCCLCTRMVHSIYLQGCCQASPQPNFSPTFESSSFLFWFPKWNFYGIILGRGTWGILYSSVFPPPLPPPPPSCVQSALFGQFATAFGAFMPSLPPMPGWTFIKFTHKAFLFRLFIRLDQDSFCVSFWQYSERGRNSCKLKFRRSSRTHVQWKQRDRTGGMCFSLLNCALYQPWWLDCLSASRGCMCLIAR